MEIKLLKILEANIHKGELESVKKVLYDERHHISAKHSVFLIVTCCKACCNCMNDERNNPNDMIVSDLITILQHISSSIVSLDEKEFDSYLQSMFYICKYLLKQEMRLILDVRNEIIPSWIPQSMTDKQKGTYRSICDLIKNNFITSMQSEKKLDQRDIISISCLISSVLRLSQNLTVFCTYVYKFGVAWVPLEISYDTQIEFFLFNQDIIRKASDKDRHESIQNFIEYGLFLAAEFLKHGQLSISKLCIEKLFETIPNTKEWLNLKEILKLCNLMIDINDSFDILSFKTALTSAIKYDNMRDIWKYIANLVKSFHHFCKNHASNEFFVLHELHVKLYEAINELVKTLNMEPCSGECVCSSQKQISEADSLMVSMINLFSTISSQTNLPSRCVDEVLSYIQCYCDFIVSLKSNNCEEWDVHWLNIEVHIHNLGVILLRKKYFKNVILLGKMILEYSYTLSKVENTKVSLKTKSLMSTACLGEHQYREALMWVALEILNTPKTMRTNALQAWIKIKLEAKTDDVSTTVQDLTIVSVIEEANIEFKYFSKKMSDTDRKELLIQELEIYCRKWKSKLPMMSAFRKLCNVADNFTLMKVFAKVFMDWHINIHDDMFKLLDEIFLEFESSLNSRIDANQSLLSMLMNLFRYRNQVTEKIKKNVMEMNRNIKVYKAPPAHPSDVLSSDVYNECDVICSYEGLRANKIELKILEKCLNELEEIMVSGSFQTIIDIMELETLYNITRNIAMEFNLNNDSYHCIKAFHLAQTIAEHSGNDLLLLDSTGFLMKLSSNCKLENKVSSVLSNLARNEKSYEYLIQFFINMTDVYISERKIEKAMKYFEKALEIFEVWSSNTASSNWCSDVSIEYFRFKLLEVSTSPTTITKTVSRFGPLLKAYDLIVEKYSSAWEWSPSCFSLLFDVMMALIGMYHELRMPREVRCFGEDALRIAQQLMLSIESVKILTYLAKSDLLSEQFDNCRVKLDGIANILELKPDKKGSFEEQQEKTERVAQITQEIQSLKLDHDNVLIHHQNNSPSSPIHCKETYALSFLHNHENCNCLSCTSVAYQYLVLTSFHLEALWHMQKSQITLANRFFRECLDLYQFFSQKSSLKKSCSPEKNGHKHSFCFFEENNYRCLIDYVKFLYMSGAVEIARKYNRTLLKRMSVERSCFPTLYSEALLQQLALFYEIEDKEIEKLEVLSSTETDSIMKTPEQVRKNVLFTEKKEKKVKVIRPNVIKFNIMDANSESSKATPLKKNNKNPISSMTPKRLPPSLRSKKTPVPTLKFNNSNTIQLEPSSSTSENASKMILNESSDVALKKSLHAQETPKTKFAPKMKENLMEVNTKKLICKLKKKLPDESNAETDDQNHNLLKSSKDGDVYPLRRTRRNRT